MKYLPLVNIKQGTASRRRYSNGNTLPLTQLPFAMCGFAPQTSSAEGWFYHPDDRCIEAVRLTHQPSPWIADYGTLLFFPQKFQPYFEPDARWSGYRPEDAVLTPAYIKLDLLRSRSVFELTPTIRGAQIKVHFDNEKDNYFSVMSAYGESEFILENGELTGFVSNNNGDFNKNFRMYFVIRFNEDAISQKDCIVGTSGYSENGSSIKAEGAGIHIRVTGTELSCCVAASYISIEQARENFRQDHSGRDFEKVKNDAEEIWEKRLSSVEIESDCEKQLRTFYSCMYRAFLFPHRCYEINSDGKKIHYAPFDGTVREGVRYTDNGFWDTYRTCYPFYALVAKDDYAEMCEGFVNDYLECGWLPRWPSIGERGCMPSTLIDAVLCDAAVKGILKGDTLEKAFEGMLKHANHNSEHDDFGRSGCESYLKYGYVPIEAHRESVNLTEDAAYGDWCIAVIADILGKNDIAREYNKRAGNYKNLFDRETGFMRPRYENGSFRAEFSPTGWGRDYTEGSAWQNSFAVPHDIEGLAELYGGKAKLIEKIDELFDTPPVYESVGYGGEIHEETEMAAVDFGQCAISNQPSFHIPYIYSALGNVEKTAFWTEKICRELFSDEKDGFPGDEDNGSMALWYVFSTMGFYPFCPGKNEYVKTKQLVKKCVINGKTFDPDDFEGNKIPYEKVR